MARNPARIGIVCYWFNRGQATVGRHIRSIFDARGDVTFVLARPTQDSFVRPRYTADADVWRQERVTVASAFQIPEQEYLDWVRRHDIDTVFFDQNYQFDAVRRLRAEGVVTIGRFVWESFGEQHAAAARAAYSVIYSLTRCERDRYADLGIASPYLSWGCHPELLEYGRGRENEGRRVFYAGGYLSARKPTGSAVAAFRNVPDPRLSLLIKCQRPLRADDLLIPARLEDVHAARRGKRPAAAPPLDDPRITVNAEDVPTDEYCRLFSGSDIALAPSRWEGLGLHLYEALAFGVPTISMDIPPINEVVTDGCDGLLVESRPIGCAASGVIAYEPDVGALSRAIRTLAEPAVAAEFARNIAESRRKFSWDRTASAFVDLVHGAVGAAA